MERHTFPPLALEPHKEECCVRSLSETPTRPLPSSLEAHTAVTVTRAVPLLLGGQRGALSQAGVRKPLEEMVE